MGTTNILLHPFLTATICSFLDDHMESESYNKHAAVMLRHWPCITTGGWNRWKNIPHVILPEIAVNQPLWNVGFWSYALGQFHSLWSFFIWSVLHYHNYCPTDMKYYGRRMGPALIKHGWKHNSEDREKWDVELWLLLGVVPLLQSQWSSSWSKSMMQCSCNTLAKTLKPVTLTKPDYAKRYVPQKDMSAT